MPAKYFGKLALGMLFISTFSRAQKSVMISDSLAANAEKFNVKPGSQGPGKMWKIHFGDYGVVTSKTGWIPEKVKGNLLATKIETTSTVKFHFVFSGKTPDTAWVNAANNVVMTALQSLEIFPHFSWGTDEITRGIKNFSAFITINQDTVNTWGLFMTETKGTQTEESSEAFLTCGQRKIILSPVSSGKKSASPFSMQAEGYEFFENGHSLSALQYFGGIGMNSDIVWLNKELDPRMKLILSAAMTTVLQVKLYEMTNQAN
jgi:hypothetical protein